MWQISMHYTDGAFTNTVDDFSQALVLFRSSVVGSTNKDGLMRDGIEMILLTNVESGVEVLTYSYRGSNE